MPTTKTYTTRPIEAFGRLVAIWILVNVGADLLNVVVACIDLSIMARLPGGAALDEFGGVPDPAGITLITGLLRIPILIVAVVTAILVLKWIYRANRNAHALARGLESNPPWAVAWFFIPFAFLWKPFEPMEESWKVSRGADRWRAQPTPPVLRWWFGLWLAGTLLGNLTFRLSMGAKTVGQLQTFTMIEVIIACASIASALCLRFIVKEVSQGLERQINTQTF